MAKCVDAVTSDRVIFFTAWVKSWQLKRLLSCCYCVFVVFMSAGVNTDVASEELNEVDAKILASSHSLNISSKSIWFDSLKRIVLWLITFFLYLVYISLINYYNNSELNCTKNSGKVTLAGGIERVDVLIIWIVTFFRECGTTYGSVRWQIPNPFACIYFPLPSDNNLWASFWSHQLN